jgi:hypothetical protein
MKIRNILPIILIFTASVVMLFVTCTGGEPAYVTGEFVPFEYPVPDGMITDEAEKEAMIKAKIENLQETNLVYWGKLPASNDTMTKGFQAIWSFIRTEFPGFIGLVKTENNPDGVDFDEYGRMGYQAIDEAESYGEYATILTKMGWILQEGHTSIETRRISGGNDLTPYRPNSPVLRAGFTISMIGACYTVTENEEMVITEIDPDEDNPYNFKKGDEIVGFNGIPWAEWLPHLMEADLPVVGSPASNEAAIWYKMLRLGMTNVNLFEKINIKRVDTGEIETMDIGFIPFSFTEYYPCPDYIGDVKGVSRPKVSVFYGIGDTITYGVMEDENIGYMYITECPSGFREKEGTSVWDPYETEWSREFNRIVLELMKETDGIIIDLRYNVGGRNETFYLGLSKLIDNPEDKTVFTMLSRDYDNPDITALNEIGTAEAKLKGDDTDYDKPVVILTGPDCISACDFLIAFFDLFPEEFTIIGKENNGSFTGVSGDTYDLGEDTVSRYIPLQVGAYKYGKDDFDILLRRADFVDEFVWHTKESIINDIDNVRQRAIEIIKEGK